MNIASIIMTQAFQAHSSKIKTKKAILLLVSQSSKKMNIPNGTVSISSMSRGISPKTKLYSKLLLLFLFKYKLTNKWIVLCLAIYKEKRKKL